MDRITSPCPHEPRRAAYREKDGSWRLGYDDVYGEAVVVCTKSGLRHRQRALAAGETAEQLCLFCGATVTACDDRPVPKVPEKPE